MTLRIVKLKQVYSNSGVLQMVMQSLSRAALVATSHDAVTPVSADEPVLTWARMA